MELSNPQHEAFAQVLAKQLHRTGLRFAGKAFPDPYIKAAKSTGYKPWNGWRISQIESVDKRINEILDEYSLAKFKILDKLDHGELPIKTVKLSPRPPQKPFKFSLLDKRGNTIARADTKESLKLFFAPDYQILATYGA